MKTPALTAAILLVAIAEALAAAPDKPADNGSLLPGGNSKEPVSIEADKLVYADKEQKAIYTGNVVLIQGDTKLTCSIMTIFMAKQAPTPVATSAAKQAPTPVATPGATPSPVAAAATPAASVGAAGDTSSVKHMDCVGPVTVLSKTQTATGDNATYDKPQNKVWLTGHVTLSDGGNVTKGDKLTYDLTTGQATVENGATTGKKRVQSQFIPSSNESTAPATPAAPAKAKASN